MAYTTIDDPEAYFQAVTFSANNTAIGSGGLSVTLPGDTAMQPDLVWAKARNATEGHALADSVRGVTKNLLANTNALEETLSEGLTAFNSDGFTVGNNGHWNASGSNMVAWCWKESATSGFDIVTATGTGSAKTISHSLSAVPHVMISKEKSGSVNDWTVYHHKNTSAPETDSLILNENNATADQDTHWNDTAPTSSVFTVGSGSVVNRSSSTYVYYLFSEKQGYSKFGSYSGNGNANGPFVYTGFKPAFVLIKSTASGVWRVWDNKRDALNPNTANFQPNAADAEYDHSSVAIDFLSSGFKPRSTDSSFNGSGTSYVYMAFAEAPFVNSNGVPCNAR